MCGVMQPSQRVHVFDRDAGAIHAAVPSGTLSCGNSVELVCNAGAWLLVIRFAAT